MPITASEAAEIARAHGLSLSDAVALSRLSATVEEAQALAAQFAPEAPEPDMNTKIRKQAGAIKHRQQSAAAALFRRGGQ
jgi:hypothetical protein